MIELQEAVVQAEVLEPDVILMDLVMPVMDGVEASRRILTHHRAARILVLTHLKADEQVLAAVRAGVQGYVHKAAPPDELLEALRDVHRGELVFPAALTRKFLASEGSSTGTETKLQALREAWGTLHTKLHRPEVTADVVPRDHLLARLEA